APSRSVSQAAAASQNNKAMALAGANAGMRTAYRALAWIVAVEVPIQAASITYAVFGLGRWIQEGGVLDKSVMESEVSAFPEEVGFMVHGLNGEMVTPVLALLLLVVSFFAKVPRGVALAGGVVGLVALQVL